MSALPQTESEPVIAELPEPKGPGARLRDARLARKLEIDIVAAQLHLSSNMLIALEADDYAGFPARVFVVGYMKNYARFLNLPVEAILQSLDRVLPARPEEETHISKVGNDASEMFKPGLGASRGSFPFFSLFLLITAIGALFAWHKGYIDIDSLSTGISAPVVSEPIFPEPIFPEQLVPGAENATPAISTPVPSGGSIAIPPRQQTPDSLSLSSPADKAEVSHKQPVEEPINGSAAVTAAIKSDVAAATSDEASSGVVESAENTEIGDMATGSNTPPAAEPVVESPAETVAALPADSASGIVLSLTGESWVEVRDDSGKFRMVNLYPAGTEKTFEGTAPYRILIGNAAGASISVDGQIVDLAPHTRANVARLTINP